MNYKKTHTNKDAYLKHKKALEKRKAIITKDDGETLEYHFEVKNKKN